MRGLALVMALIVAGTAAGGERFSGDGTTVVDSEMGLLWMQKSPDEAKTLPVAEIRCGKLELAGRSDWRLPTRAELRSLLEPESDEEIRIAEPFELSTCCAWSSEEAEYDRVWAMDYVVAKETALRPGAWGVATVLCVTEDR